MKIHNQISKAFLSQMFLTFHNYDQSILYPYGYKKGETEDVTDQKDLAQKGADAASWVNGRSYRVGSAAKMLGKPAAGGSDDWAYETAKIKYSYTIELPPRTLAEGGFELDASKAEGVGKEALAMTAAMIEGLN